MKQKSRVIAALLAFFLGGLGVHQFYLGNTGRGILHIVLLVIIIGAPISALLALIDFIKYIIASDEEFNERYAARSPR